MSNKDTPEFVDVVAHELKTPINAMQGFLQLVERSGPLTETQAQFLSRAFMSLNKMTRLVNDLLDLARLESDAPLKLTQVNLEQLIQDIVLDLPEHNLQIHLPSHAAEVTADARLMRFVLQNMIANAVKYNREDGSVWINISNNEADVQVDVIDDGMGIPEASLPQVFDRFYRVRNDGKGTGLGLSICKMVVERHGGRMWATSEFGKGSQFSFVLPR